MKQSIRFLTLALALVMLALAMVACGSTSSKPSTTTPPKEEETESKECTFTVYVDGTPIAYTAIKGEIAHIDVPTKFGYYFDGAYDAEVGGQKYFDESGASTMVWDKTKPTELYARFESIDTLFYSVLELDESPATWVDEDFSMTFELDQKMKNAIAANLDETMIVEISFAITHTNNRELNQAYLTNMEQSGEKFFLVQSTTFLNKDHYQTFSETFEMKAKLLKDGNLYLVVDGASFVLFQSNHFSIKNIALSVCFEGYVSGADEGVESAAESQP